MTVYNLPKNYIYVNVPRTASGSMSLVFGGGGHEPALHFKERFKGNWDIPFKFGFTRNPYDRFSSAFHHLSYMEGEDINYHVQNKFHKLIKEEYALIRPVWEYLCDEDGNILVDFVGRFERLQEDYRYICAVVGVSEPLKRVNVARWKKRPLTEASLKVLKEFYKKDFKIFGYDPVL